MVDDTEPVYMSVSRLIDVFQSYLNFVGLIGAWYFLAFLYWVITPPNWLIVHMIAVGIAIFGQIWVIWVISQNFKQLEGLFGPSESSNTINENKI